MDIKKFRQVNEALANRFSFSLIIILVLSVVCLMQQIHISTREEIVIDRPLLQSERPMKMIRDQATRDVSESWSFNLAMLVGNMNPQSYAYIEAITFSIFSPKVRENLMPVHQDLLKKMKEHNIDITFQPNNEIEYDPKTGWVTITGIRTVRSLVDPKAKPKKIPYGYKILMDVNGFRPVVKDWKEAEL